MASGWIPAFAPTLTVTEHGSSSSGRLQHLPTTAVSTTTPAGLPRWPPIDGTQELQFRVSDELVARGGGLDAQLLGGCVPNGGTGGPAPDCCHL